MIIYIRYTIYTNESTAPQVFLMNLNSIDKLEFGFWNSCSIKFEKHVCNLPEKLFFKRMSEINTSPQPINFIDVAYSYIKKEKE